MQLVAACGSIMNTTVASVVGKQIVPPQVASAVGIVGEKVTDSLLMGTERGTMNVPWKGFCRTNGPVEETPIILIIFFGLDKQ